MSDTRSVQCESLVLLFSGKRCSGKDTIGKLVTKHLSNSSRNYEIANFADEFKKMFCLKAGLDFVQMMSDREYKVPGSDSDCVFAFLTSEERNRAAMTAYYNEIRETVDFADLLFQRVLKERNSANKKTFLICDVREVRDIENFKSR